MGTKSFLVCFFLALALGHALGEPIQIVEKDFVWLSSTLTEVTPPVIKQDPYQIRGTPLVRERSYRNYFDQIGGPPPYPFLRSMKGGHPSIAQIKDGCIFFHKTGKKVPVIAPSFPPGANPVPPYLLTTPNGKWVLVIYPYYLYQDKENRHLTEVYTDRGDRVAVYESLPTHVLASNPDLFVSPERSGCCESLKWSIRFYNPRGGSVSEFSCPEGFCGDVLFTKLEPKGPLIVIEEIVGRADEIGASMQTNVYVVEPDGKLAASGKTLYAVRATGLSRKQIDSLSPFAISNLVSVEPDPGKLGWLFYFEIDGERRVLRLVSTETQPALSVTFVLSKDPSMSGRGKMVKTGERSLGFLPLLVVSEPGKTPFQIHHGDGKIEEIVKEIESDYVNILLF
ncbi:MAG: hypothetical protein A2156_11055 [Deltaproteobacteria bacterium RBG_16_48_10]|nr:MAG: hypothetical protein A2156_11055 [Deltaproteobacteria bacterium RBG_16_48_10]